VKSWAEILGSFKPTLCSRQVVKYCQKSVAPLGPSGDSQIIFPCQQEERKKVLIRLAANNKVNKKTTVSILAAKIACPKNTFYHGVLDQRLTRRMGRLAKNIRLE
jgi:hypothetical protein